MVRFVSLSILLSLPYLALCQNTFQNTIFDLPSILGGEPVGVAAQAQGTNTYVAKEDSYKPVKKEILPHAAPTQAPVPETPAPFTFPTLPPHPTMAPFTFPTHPTIAPFTLPSHPTIAPFTFPTHTPFVFPPVTTPAPQAYVPPSPQAFVPQTVQQPQQPQQPQQQYYGQTYNGYQNNYYPQNYQQNNNGQYNNGQYNNGQYNNGQYNNQYNQYGQYQNQNQNQNQQQQQQYQQQYNYNNNQQQQQQYNGAPTAENQQFGVQNQQFRVQPQNVQTGNQQLPQVQSFEAGSQIVNVQPVVQSVQPTPPQQVLPVLPTVSQATAPRSPSAVHPSVTSSSAKMPTVSSKKAAEFNKESNKPVATTVEKAAIDAEVDANIDRHLWFSADYDIKECRKNLTGIGAKFQKKFPSYLQKGGKDHELSVLVEQRLHECERKSSAAHWDKVDALLQKINLTKSEEGECRAGLIQERISCVNLLKYACQFVDSSYLFKLVPARITIQEARQAESGADKCRQVVRIVKQRLESGAVVL